MSDIAPLEFDQLDDDPRTFNVVLYGPAGSGKTTAAATAPGPILWLNAQGPGAFAPAKREAARRGTEIMRVTIPKDKKADVVGIVRSALAHWKRNADPAPRTIVVDTIGDLRDRLAKQLVTGPQSKTRDQWGEVTKVLREFVLGLRDDPVNLVLVAHEAIEDNDDDRIIRPKIGGVLTEEIVGEMDVVAYCGIIRDLETGAREYHGQFVEVRGRRAKDRSDALGEHRRLDLSEWLPTYLAGLNPEPDAADDSMFYEGDEEPEVAASAYEEDLARDAEDVTAPAPAAAAETTPEAPETATGEFDPATGKLRAVPDAPAEDAPDPEQQTLGESITAEDLLTEIRNAGVKANEFRGIVKSVGLEPPSQLTAKDHYMEFLDGVGGAKRDAILLALGRRAKVMAGAAS